MAIIWIYY